MLIIPIALQERGREHGVPSDTSNEQPGQNATSLCSDAGRSEGRDVTEYEDQGSPAEQPPAVVPEHTFDGDQHNESAHDSVWSKRDENQQFPASGASTQTPEQENGTTSECTPRHAR